MPAEPNLSSAALNAYANLYPSYGAVGPRLIAFAAAAQPTFPDNDPNSRPVSNWLAVIAAFGTSDTNAGPWSSSAPGELAQGADFVYRVCLLANYLNGAGLISNAQAAALLAAYNAQI